MSSLPTIWSSALRRWPLVLAMVTSLASTGCGDVLSSERPGPSSVALSLGIAQQLSGEGALAAYMAADRIRVLLYFGREEEMIDLLLPFDGTSAVTRIPLVLDLESEEEVGAYLSVEMLLGEATLFYGDLEFSITPGRIVNAEVELVPVATGVAIQPEEVTIVTRGGTAQLTAYGVFATGDLFPGLPVVWAGDGELVEVNQQGLVTALFSGDAQVFATYGNLFDQATVFVRIPGDSFRF